LNKYGVKRFFNLTIGTIHFEPFLSFNDGKAPMVNKLPKRRRVNRTQEKQDYEILVV
jgi:hypothetical protein